MGSECLPGRLLSQLVDEQAKDHPNRLYCLHPTSQDAHCQWHPITFQGLSYAVDRVARWIAKRIPGQKQQVLAYIGTNDLRYCAFALACMKTGHAALFLSTRNSPAAFRHLLSATRCSVLVDGSDRPQLQKTIDQIEVTCSDLGLARWRIDPIGDIFAPSPVEPYPHEETFHEIEDRPAIIIHSSGTTGLPRPVGLTHGYLATLDQMQTLPVPPGRETAQMFQRHRGQMRFLHGPLFHFIGLVCMSECIFYETPFLLSPDRPLTPDLFARVMATPDPPRWGLLAPFVLQDLWSSAKGREALQRLSGLNSGGASLASATGDAMSAWLRLQTLMGSSETGYTPTLLCQDPADWEFFEWNPAFAHRMEKVGDGLWELVLPRPSSRRYHGIFHVFPQLTEYRTNDLFEPHPSKANLWRSKGRGDDVIVLNNGEKLNPIDAERLLESHPLISHAAIFGQDRFQVALLLELRWGDLPPSWTPESLRIPLQPLVEQANALLPAHGKIHPSHITLASPDRPFALSPKGSVRRRETAQLYEDILNQLYTLGTAPATANEGIGHPQESTLEGIQKWMQQSVARMLGESTIGLDDDVVNLGMDSLQVVQLARALHDTAQKMNPSKPPTVPWDSAAVYEHASVRRLANVLFGQINGCMAGTGDPPRAAHWPREHRLARAVWQQAQHLHLHGRTVLLTGSTGELGSYLLHELLQDPSIAEIYCLNRSPDAESRQLVAFQEKQLADGWLMETRRVKFWQVDLSREHLGLTADAYHHLRQRVHMVIHNAWMVNFNLPMAKFDAQLEGTRRLLTLVNDSPHRAAFHFISSIATISGHSNPNSSPIPETLHDASIVLPQGYAESKFAAETLCDLFSKETPATMAIHRVGQLGGPSHEHAGMWTSRDWFPALIRSSKTMGLLPDSLGPIPVDWVPIDIAARGIKQIASSFTLSEHQPEPSISESSPTGAKVYHITNPHPSKWEPLAQVVSQACAARIVPLSEWVQVLGHRVSESNFRPEELRDLPAAQLLGFFSSLVEARGWMRPSVDTTRARRYSAAIRGLGPVDAELMKVWLRQWGGWIPGLRV
ncbi:NRPS-like enzyme [Aspergillus sclerotiicarbonarius CBS 121057]|uniref:NRPS-like enzyme n=1 Tax=Aspergillus sclerotiicarbonarius (strain CBS 121057 / IBT 28362) TaxID=1448318 RepID=A0A319EJA7_ASPSB|nr:NRPS-like enzyme [Aspergillus sclerotiicarbonarius CBS 121057]